MVTRRTDRAELSCALPGLDPESYACWRATEIGMITGRIEQCLMLELVGHVSGKRVLDVGCGDGDFALALSRRGAIVTAIVSSDAMVSAAKRRCASENAEVVFHVGTAQSLPFGARQFDIVVAVTVLCFVEDAGPVFREIARVLRPGGKLVIGELGKWSTWAAERRIRAWLGSALWQRGRFRTPRELSRLARAAGLVPELVRGAIYYPRWPLAARWMARFDARIGRHTLVGAAFLALSATKGHDRPT